MYADDTEYTSIHVSPWPKPDRKQIDEEAEKYGALVMAIIEEIRRDKAERKMPLNTPIKKLAIYSGTQENAQVLNQATQDIEGTCKTQELKILAQKGEGQEIRGYPDIRFAAEY
jgi:valyl-tRNA synthetase